MGRLAFAAKITHVPSMYLSELDGPHKGCREAAIEGHREISRRCRALGVDTIVVWAQGTPIAQLVRSMEKINYFPLVLSSWAADNITFYDAAGKALAEKPIFMRTVSETRTPAQQKLFERIGAKLKAPGSFSFALHGYDSVLLYAAAAKQAGSVDGPAVRVWR